MANLEHLEILRRAVKVWNKWRDERPEIRPDLRRANLNGVDFSGANLSGANLSGADFTDVILDSTNFEDNDLSNVKALETAQHLGPSFVGIRTFYSSSGQLPLAFLRGCGIPESFILKFHGSVTQTEKQNDQDREAQVERIIRSIEFPPEYYHSGITILSYFTDVLRHQKLSENVKVSIEQAELNVRLIIESPEGQRELIERTLEAYALVVTGKQPIETLTTDPYEIAELKSQLRIANAQIENQRDLLALKSTETEATKASLQRLEQRSDEDRARLMTLIEGLVSHNMDLSSSFRRLTEKSAKLHNEALSGALENLYKMVERGVQEEDKSEVIQNLSTIQRENPSVLKQVSDILIKGAISGAAGNYLYSWLLFFIASLPK